MDVRNKVLHVEKEIKAVQKEILEAGEVTKKLTFLIFFFSTFRIQNKVLSDFDAYVWQNNFITLKQYCTFSTCMAGNNSQ